MIKKLNKNDQQRMLELVKKEKELNLFIIGDVENYGFDKDFLEYWGYENEEGMLVAILMRFYEFFIVYADEDFDVEGFKNIMEEKNYQGLSGSKKIVDKFDKHLNVSKKREMYFAKLESKDKLYKGELLNNIEKTKVEDVKLIKELFDKIEEFDTVSTLDRMKKKYIDKTGRGYHIKLNESIAISNAETSAENSMSAMVIGVCTHPEHGKKGYATAVVSKLCDELLREGKTACLFYDNPKAGNIYKRIGFEDIGIWSMWKK